MNECLLSSMLTISMLVLLGHLRIESLYRILSHFDSI